MKAKSSIFHKYSTLFGTQMIMGKNYVTKKLVRKTKSKT